MAVCFCCFVSVFLLVIFIDNALQYRNGTRIPFECGSERAQRQLQQQHRIRDFFLNSRLIKQLNNNLSIYMNVRCDCFSCLTGPTQWDIQVAIAVVVIDVFFCFCLKIIRVARISRASALKYGKKYALSHSEISSSNRIHWWTIQKIFLYDDCRTFFFAGAKKRFHPFFFCQIYFMMRAYKNGLSRFQAFSPPTLPSFSSSFSLHRCYRPFIACFVFGLPGDAPEYSISYLHKSWIIYRSGPPSLLLSVISSHVTYRLCRHASAQAIMTS